MAEEEAMPSQSLTFPPPSEQTCAWLSMSSVPCIPTGSHDAVYNLISDVARRAMIDHSQPDGGVSRDIMLSAECSLCLAIDSDNVEL